MAFKLVSVEPTIEAFEELADALWVSYETPYQTFFHLFFPYIGKGEEGRAAGIKATAVRLLAENKSDPSIWWGKVVDEAGKIAGGCLWKIYKTNPYDKHEEHPIDWYQGEEREYAEQAFQLFDGPREDISNRPHVFLNILFTLPDYRRRGVADIILKWGTDKADEMGVEMWLDATIHGRPAYVKHGFVVIKENRVLPTKADSGPAWKNLDDFLQPMHFWVMWRPIGGVYVEGETTKPWETEAAK